MYDTIEYLSQTEADTHMICLKSLKIIAEFRKRQRAPQCEDDLEDLLQELKKVGLLEPLLVFEISSVPEIRDLAGSVLSDLTNV